MGRRGDNKVKEFVDHGRAVGTRHLVAALGIPPAQASDLMLTILYDICAQYGKGSMYVPAVLEIGRTERDQRIAQAHATPGPTGSRPYSHERVEEIAAVEELTPRHVYAILKLCRQRDAADRQQSVAGVESVDEAKARLSGRM